MSLFARTILWLVFSGVLCVAAGSSAFWWDQNIRQPYAEQFEPTTFFTYSAPPQTSPQAFETRRIVTLTYKTTPNQTFQADIHFPQTLTRPKRGWPVVVSFHSGAWRGGHRSQVPISELVEMGFVVVSPDFRKSDEAIFPAQLDDSREFINWLVAHGEEHQLDISRIGLFGASSGGHLALLTALQKDHHPNIRAVCTLYAPTSFETLEDGPGEHDDMNHFAPWSPESLLLGGPIPDRLPIARQASPCWHASSAESSPAVLLMHGIDDRQIPFHQALQLTQIMQQRQLPVTLWKIKSLPHGSWPSTRISSGVAKFFSKHLDVAWVPLPTQSYQLRGRETSPLRPLPPMGRPR